MEHNVSPQNHKSVQNLLLSPTKPLGIALTIAGTDPSGGAGVMADLKSFQSRQVYGMAAITSVVAQNTKGVQSIQNVDLTMLDAQLRCVYEDIAPKAVKTGMIPNVEMMRIIRNYVDGSIPYVMDPVMVATSGDYLIDKAARDQFKSELMPVATLVTPNLSEAEFLVGFSIESETDIAKAAQVILNEMGPKAVVIKGGHFGTMAKDYLFIRGEQVKTYESPKLDTKHTHGTGCTFSAVITAELAKGKALEEAVWIGKQFIARAIAQNPSLGHGHGPVNHMVFQGDVEL
ncbi:bifunctional hydroxymethylpyrimidine kinase/phosphomethylpyrimidine kinase [uncultured Veillonella sp.]|uniref:bifunctional hydroxymethylpyrimidine kinase/phosphomethylpyrimidine kinase n=1 Tax=uncultured Veillonella sp. TaxID=159268 RepID=UPI0026206DF5|nr:bifunctional hydroxymethylpyrimidine kinase/phosphomethylpyrimidine kinase [uncultured Veillonella sp.]